MPEPDTVVTATLATTAVLKAVPAAMFSVPPLSEQLPPVTKVFALAFTRPEVSVRPAEQLTVAAAVSVPPETVVADAYGV